MSWLPPSDGRLPITDTVALSYEIGWLRHRRIFTGYFITELTEEAMSSEYMKNYFDVVLPMNRCGKQGELDTTILYLASPNSSYTTGAILSVDGGFTAI